VALSLIFVFGAVFFSFFFFFSSRRRHTRLVSDWSSDVCSSDLRDTPCAGTAARPARAAPGATGPRRRWPAAAPARRAAPPSPLRSEERRVGKEGRYRWGAGE